MPDLKTLQPTSIPKIPKRSGGPIDAKIQLRGFLHSKSRQRIRDHAEVFTPPHIVSAMLHLVQHETERIESRFLEPACGTGNFILPILEQKLSIVSKRYGRSQVEFERMAAIAVGSIYGIELLSDNAEICRRRLFNLFDELYTLRYKKHTKDALRKSIQFILNRNIVVGDALSLKTVGNKPEPITFSEWSLVHGSNIKRRDYAFHELIPNNEADQGLFADMRLSDMDEPVFTPKPVKEYPITHVLKLAYATSN